jgi:DnaK suppressor protein
MATDDSLSDDPRLTAPQQKQLHDLLERSQRQLIKQAQAGLELSMNRDTDVGRDSIDESSEEELLSTELRLRDREKKLLQKIENALARLKEDTINVCEDCGGAIGFKRLLVRPVTTLCIDCKEQREAHEDIVEMTGRNPDSRSIQSD